MHIHSAGLPYAWNAQATQPTDGTSAKKAAETRRRLSASAASMAEPEEISVWEPEPISYGSQSGADRESDPPPARFSITV